MQNGIILLINCLLSLFLTVNADAQALIARALEEIAEASQVVLGDEQADVYLPLLEGKRVALFSNHTGIAGDVILTEAAEVMNDPLITVPGSSVPLRLMECSDSSVTVESVKLAEDGSGDLVIRMYESMGGARSALIHPFLPFSAARICSVEEEPGEKLPVKDDTFTVFFRPFEIVTVRLAGPAPRQ